MPLAIFLSTLLSGMLIGMPIAFALILCGVALMMYLGLVDPQIIAQNLIHGVDSFPLLAIPFFLLAGEVMNAGGLSKRIIAIAMAMVGHKRGGLGYVTIIAGIILASLSGSAVADAAALAAFLVPMMAQAGYDKGRSAGLVSASGLIGPIIPPSIPFIFFGVIAQVSITKLFFAGIAPGMMMGIALATVWWFLSRNEENARTPKVDRHEFLRRLVDGVWALGLPFIIIFGLRTGIVTPTEAAVIAAVYSIFVATCIYREVSLRALYDLALRAGITSSIVLFLIGCALLISWLITVSGVSSVVTGLLEPLIAFPRLLVASIAILIVVLGTAIELGPILLILTPIVMPAIKAAGVDPVYFGVIFIFSGVIGLITPPVGIVLTVVAGVTKLKFEEVVRGVWPFLFAQIVVLALMIAFPSIVEIPARFFAGS